MAVPGKIVELIERFKTHQEVFVGPQYKEAHVRREFIDPFFECLGWDMSNAGNVSELYKDVIAEDTLRIDGRAKAPDYSFRAGGLLKFFVEAKRPAIRIVTDPEPAYQVKRYAWTARLPISLVTNFEELVIYDCRARPTSADKPAVGRLRHWKYTDFVEKWEDIRSILGRDAVHGGSIEGLAATLKSKRGTVSFDSAFLAEIEDWRDSLARNIALRNPALTQPDLNFAVQQLIDRIIFLRICEDRDIEPYGRLQSLRDTSGIYAQLLRMFRQADDKYDSGLFHFRSEQGSTTEPDSLSLRLQVDDKPLKAILHRLYYPESPYAFSLIPADILGQIYERFLGKLIRLTPGHRAVVEDKPEVKKAGGVYYTPTYIVDHIVAKTVGAHCEGKTPKDLSNLRMLDPACGSGSFLIVAYQVLLDWHLQWYLANDPKKFTKGKAAPLQQTATGGWRLTTGERKRILVNNIYGVDIDAQAVEVTKLSLLLKVLEGESSETLNRQLTLFAERALPDLDANIRCGNSLIGPELLETAQLNLLSEADQTRINLFSWEDAFPRVFKRPTPGFDVIVGNPPYINIRNLQEYAPIEVEYYKDRYQTAARGSYDIYVIFVERGLSLLRRDGRLGYILPSKFFTTDYGEPLRKLLAERRAVSEIVDFRHTQVFANATTYTALLFLSGRANVEVAYRAVAPPSGLLGTLPAPRTIEAKRLSAAPWELGSQAEQALMRKLESLGTPLMDLPTHIARGSSTGADKVFMLVRSGNTLRTREGQLAQVEPEALRIPLYASDFSRYHFKPEAHERVIFPYDVTAGGYRLIPEGDLRKRFPRAYAYLASQRQQLEERKQYADWYAYSAPRSLDVHDAAQMVVPLLANQGLYSELPADRNSYCLMASGGFSLSVSPECPLSPSFVLGLLNSRLLFWYLRRTSNAFRGGWVTCTKQFVGPLPIRRIDFSDASEAEQHQQIASAAETLVDLRKKLDEAKTPSGRNQLLSRVSALENQLHQRVYTLYKLSKEEIALVDTEVGAAAEATPDPE